MKTPAAIPDWFRAVVATVVIVVAGTCVVAAIAGALILVHDIVRHVSK